jgi:hypothetical protein
MRRRDFNQMLAGVGVTALTAGLASNVNAQDSDEDYNADILDSVMSELQVIAGQRIDAVGRSEIAAADRSSLRINRTVACFPAPP